MLSLSEPSILQTDLIQRLSHSSVSLVITSSHLSRARRADGTVVTKCDDISPKEIARSLRLGDNPQYKELQNDINHHKAEAARWKGQEKSTSNAYRSK